MQGSEGPTAEDLQKASADLRRLLVEGIAAQRQWGREVETPQFDLVAQALLHRLEEETSPLELLSIATEMLEAFENQTRNATGYFREQSGQMQAMLAMLTETVADISGQSEASVARLQAVERQIERASRLEDIRELKASLAACLAEVKEAAIQQRNAARATADRLQDHIQKAAVPEAVTTSRGATGAGGSEYLVAFKLQRAEHILARFGEATVEQMLGLIAEGLKPALGGEDRLVRWNGPSFAMFLRSSESAVALRRRLSAAVLKIGQRYVEAGTNSALLAVGVDWLIFPQAQYPSPEMARAEMEAFLARKTEEDGKAAGAAAKRPSRPEEPNGGVAK